MTTAILNRHNVESVVCEFIQTGRDETMTTLTEDLLDGTKEYIFCVDN